MTFLSSSNWIIMCRVSQFTFHACKDSPMMKSILQTIWDSDDGNLPGKIQQWWSQLCNLFWGDFMTWWKPSWWSSAMSWCALPPVNSSAWSCCYRHPVTKGVIAVKNVSSSSLSSRSIIIQLTKCNSQKRWLTSSSSFFSPWNLTTKRLTPYSGRLSHALSIQSVMKIPHVWPQACDQSKKY